MAAQAKPLVVFVFSEDRGNTTKYRGFAARLKKAGGLKNCEVLTVALNYLNFIIEENGEADVIDPVSGRSLSEASLVYMKSRWGAPEEASALANYLFYKGIPFMDTSALSSVISKVPTLFSLWGNNVSVPLSLYARNHEKMLELLKKHKRDLGEKFVLKDAKGAKGKLNFFVALSEVPKIFKEHPDVLFIAQRFIPNAGDYRIGVYCNKARFVIKRVGKGDTHLNNTSAGGTATYVPTDDMPEPLLRLAEEASVAQELQISGVDVIVDKETGRPYVLEVNQGSQIVTGAFTEQNMAALNEALDEAVKHRHIRARRRPTAIVGRRTIAKLPLLGVKYAVAKVDTGAYSSTLHAEDIHIEKEDGKDVLVFDIVPGEMLQTRTGSRETKRVEDFYTRLVRSSNGKFERRYSFKTKITIHHRVFDVVLTLSDRSEMRWPLLIGRRVLRSRFLVNVELNEEAQRD